MIVQTTFVGVNIVMTSRRSPSPIARWSRPTSRSASHVSQSVRADENIRKIQDPEELRTAIDQCVSHGVALLLIG